MAITLSKTSGSGNDTFTVSADAYLGRLEQSLGTVNVTSTADATKKVAITVKQSGQGLFVSSLSNGLSGGKKTANPEAYRDFANFTIYSNAPAIVIKQLTYSTSNTIKAWNSSGHNYDEENPKNTYGDGSIKQVLMNNVDMTNSQEGSSNGTIFYVDTSTTATKSNPAAGRSSVYAITVYFSIPTNTDNDTVTRQWLVSPYAVNSGCSIASSNSALTLEVVQQAGVVTLSATPTTITIPAAGTAQTVTVTSNSSWTVATA